jgi:hypothetical protein
MAAVDYHLPSIFKPWRAPRIGLALVLLAALAASLGPAVSAVALLPIVRQWPSPDAQYRALLPDIPYDSLRAADARLPRDASVLLVTPGQDAQSREYRIFHRALYFLAPRPVWWLAPAPLDGTWRSRWRMSAPPTPEAIRAAAVEKQASYALVYGVPRSALAEWNAVDLGDGYLIRLDERLPLPDTQPRPPDTLAPAWPIRLALAVAIILALGYGALMGVARFGYRASGVEAAALSWMLGAGLTSVGMLWIDAASGSLRTQVVVVTLLGLGGLLWMAYSRLLERSRRRRTADDGRWLGMARESRVRRRDTRSPHAIRNFFIPGVLLAVLMLQVMYVAVVAVGKPLDIWDSWVTWAMKARIIFLDGSISPAVYADQSRAITHLDYPLLLPLIEAWLFSWVGAPDDRLVGVLAVLFYGALAGVCYSAVRRWGATWRFALGAAVVAVSLPQLPQISGIAFADVPLAVFVTIAAIYLIEWLERDSPGALIVAAAAGGLMPWTKREGLVLLAVICLALLLVGRGGPRAWLGVGGLLLGACILSGPWYGFVAWNGIANTDFLPITIATLRANIDRLPKIMSIVLASLFGSDWGFVWPIASLTGLLAWRGKAHAPELAARRAATLLPVLAVLYLALIGPMFVFSAFVPYEGHVLSSAYRLIAHVAPLPVLWMAYYGYRLER